MEVDLLDEGFMDIVIRIPPRDSSKHLLIAD
jgi:hypothetical protein